MNENPYQSPETVERHPQRLSDSRRGHRGLPNILQLLLAVVLLPLLLPLVILLLFAYLFYGITLQLVIWVCWCARGVNVLLVYSDSPVWHDYIEKQILPRLPGSTVVLNWSQRRQWRRFSLPVMTFRFFSGAREFNPLVVVFRPFRWARTFRLWKAFKDYKHGNPDPLKVIERQLFEYLEQSRIRSAL